MTGVFYFSIRSSINMFNQGEKNEKTNSNY